MDRIHRLANHLTETTFPLESEISGALQSNACIGESSNQEAPDASAKYDRVPIKIVFVDTSAADERYGGSGDMAILEAELLRPSIPSKTCIIFMHPSGIQNLLPMPNAMARSGLHVVTW